MGRAEWGSDPDFFGPRHAFREALLLRSLPARTAPGLHLDCAAGVGSLALSLARRGFTVVAADRSLRSLAVIRRRVREHARGVVLPVAADIGALPFRDGTFPSASTAETLEHVPDDGAAIRELARVLAPGGVLAGTVPHGPGQWSAWDDWAGHLRRYTVDALAGLLAAAGLEPRVRTWGWPLVRLYDDVFLKRVNRRRLEAGGGVEDDPALRSVQRLGRRRWLVRAVRAAFGLDRLFAGAPGGVGLIFEAHKADDGD